MAANQDLKVGDKAPDFTAKTDENEDFTLSQHVGKYIVLYFYPKDFTPGCTKEACSFRDNFPKFKVGQDQQDSTIIVGVSGDSVETHKKFKADYKLPYTLLADTDGSIRKLFGCKPSFFGLIEARKTFVLDKDGTVAYIYESQLNVNEHITGAMKTIEKLASGSK